MTTKVLFLLLRLAAPLLGAALLSQCSSPGIQAPDFSLAESEQNRAGSRYGHPSESVGREAERKRSTSLGTTWGERRSSYVTDTQFVRATSKPAGQLVIRYTDAGGRPVARSTRQPFDLGSIASVTIQSRGRKLPAYLTSSGPLVIGEDGERYTITVKNLTRQRIEVVLSVDGLDVLDGKSASFGKRGYVIGPRRSIKVEGFRRSLESVAAFRFGSIGESYAARSTGSTRNVGVIGTAIFRERSAGDWERRKHADPFPGEEGSGRFARPPGS